MKKGTFFKFLALIVLMGAFITIYQHNQVVKLLYQRRRIEMKKENLLKGIADTQVQLYALQDYTQTKSFACYQLGMTQLTLAQVITVTEQICVFDCYTSSTKA